MNEQTKDRMNQWTTEWTNKQMEEQTDESMKERMNQWRNEWIKVIFIDCLLDGTSDDFIRLGLQKLINEHVHKDSTMNKTRTGTANPTGALGPGSWKGGSPGCFPGPTQSDTIMGSYADPKTTSDTLVVSPMLQGPVTVAHRPRTTTALLEKLLSEESG